MALFAASTSFSKAVEFLFYLFGDWGSEKSDFWYPRIDGLETVSISESACRTSTFLDLSIGGNLENSDLSQSKLAPGY